MSLKFNNSWNIYDVVKYESQYEEWKIISDSLTVETLHALKYSTMHNPCQEYPRLKIMIGIAPYESCESANEKPDLRREVSIIYLFHHHNRRLILLPMS